MKIFIWIVAAILFTALGAVVGVYFYIQHQLALSQVPVPALEATTTSEVVSGTAATTPVPVTVDPIPLRNLPLTDGQKQTAETFGVDVETFVITPDMQVCAEEKLGSERFADIVSGDTPSVVESMKLLGCL